jgi:hypothetical protein
MINLPFTMKMTNRIPILLSLLLSYCLPALSQTFTDSNLPIVVINTDYGIEIPDDPRIWANMKIIYRGEGQRNYLTDQSAPEYLNYNGRIDIELRGSSSQALDKKAYGFSTRKSDNATDLNVSLLGLPADNDWILLNNVFDPSMIRNYLSYNLSRMIGEYASRTVFCELVINGQYRGLYLLLEKIKQGKDRINIRKMGTDDNKYPDVTGGYITKADKTTGNDPVAWLMSSYNWVDDIAYIHDTPKPEFITPEQNYYIRSVFFKLQDLAFAGNQSVESGYPSVIDIPSFIDYMILNELASNADAYTYSTFYHKDKNAKLRAGPIWDLDLTYGNDLFIWGYDRSKNYWWQFNNGDNDGTKYWTDLFKNAKFKCYLSKRWNYLISPGEPLNYDTITALIDRVVDQIGEALVREKQLWGTVGNHFAEISNMKSWIRQRITWISQNVGSYSDCSDPYLPQLVITKIDYAPDSSAAYPVSKDLEFLEIKNTGSRNEDLTGVYFAGTGFVYDFLPHSTISPGESIILAGDAETFRSKYGFLPYGQFTRNLSDTGEDLRLADAFGNVIDEVRYSSESPWPNASFNGYYLSLTDPSLDNNDGSNWTAESSTLTGIHDTQDDPGLKLYPSPVVNTLNIESLYPMDGIDIQNLSGFVVKSMRNCALNATIDVSSLTGGMYIVRVSTNGRILTRKIIKN